MRLWKKEKAQDAAVMLLLGAALTLHCLERITASKVKAPLMMSPYLFPVILGGAAMLLGCLLLRTAAAERQDEAEPPRLRLRDVAAVLLLSAAYDVLMTRIGFIPATALYLLAFIAFLGERRPFILIPVAALTPLVLYAVFKLGLGVRMP
ncbi:MAG: tripartite tricarboxylate transporter TctB family protein [Clostridia bacterium]|nr:tripartite tricarboxylate transporter TctB family protein [Clostridia bacterium]